MSSSPWMTEPDGRIESVGHVDPKHGSPRSALQRCRIGPVRRNVGLTSSVRPLFIRCVTKSGRGWVVALLAPPYIADLCEVSVPRALASGVGPVRYSARHRGVGEAGVGARHGNGVAGEGADGGVRPHRACGRPPVAAGRKFVARERSVVASVNARLSRGRARTRRRRVVISASRDPVALAALFVLVDRFRGPQRDGCPRARFHPESANPAPIGMDPTSPRIPFGAHPSRCDAGTAVPSW